MTEAEDFDKKGNCKHENCSVISISAWWYLNTKGTFRKWHVMSPNSNCKCQNHFIFTTKHFELQSNGFKKVDKNC